MLFILLACLQPESGEEVNLLKDLSSTSQHDGWKDKRRSIGVYTGLVVLSRVSRERLGKYEHIKEYTQYL